MDALPEDEAVRILADAPVAHVGMIFNGSPYVTPMSFVLDGRRILFRTGVGNKLEALRRDPRVCIEVSRFDADTGDWASVIATGQAFEVSDPHTAELAIQMLYQKYGKALSDPLSPGTPQPFPGMSYIVEVIIDQITGRSSGLGFAPRTRPGRL